MWRRYFKLVKLVPGKVIVQGYGTLDFSRDDIPIETCKALYETDFEFLEITEEGKRALYGVQSSEFEVQSSEFGVQSSEPEVQVSEFEVQSSLNTKRETLNKPRTRKKKQMNG